MTKFKFLRQGLPLTLSIVTTLATLGMVGVVSAETTLLNKANKTVQNQSTQSKLTQLAPPTSLLPPDISYSSTQLSIEKAQLQALIPGWAYPLGAVILAMIFLPQVGWIAGLIVIGEREVGIITKKFSAKSLPAGGLIALEGEAGLQADTLPPGWHFGYFPWQYNVQKESVIIISQDEIGLIIANDGAAIPPSRILGKVVESENFQNTRQFLMNGGEKGRQ